MEKKVLLIVDVQKGFISSNTKHIPDLVEKLQSKYDLVFATKFYNGEGSFYRTLIEWDKLAKDSEDYQLAFRPSTTTKIIEKNIYTCVNSNFLSILRQNKVSSVDIVGIDTDICVTKCAVDLFENGIKPRVLKDYCATNAGSESHKYAVKTLKRFIGKKQVI